METPEIPKAKENQADLSAGKQDRNARLAYVLKNIGMTALQSSPVDQHAMSHDELYESITAGGEKARSHRGRSLVYDEIDTALVESNVETEGPASNQAGRDFKNVMDTENAAYGTRQELLFAEMDDRSLDNYQVVDESLTFREVMKDEVLY